MKLSKKDAIKIYTEMHSVKDARGNMSHPHISFPKGLNTFHLNLIFEMYTVLRELNFILY